MKMEPQSAFIEEIETLEPDHFVGHFVARKRLPGFSLPRASEASLLNAKKILDSRFDLIGESYLLPEGFSWKENPSRDKEWQIAHHKFYFAVDLIHAYRHYQDDAFLKKWAALLESWLDEMESGYIVLSDAQVEAKRIEHWVYSFLLLQETPCRPLVSASLLRRFLERIAKETLYISEHLKPVRNHRTFQLLAVFMVGALFPEFQRHSYFVEFGKEKLTENLLTDFLCDGVHLELSTHYHQLVLESALSFVELAQLSGLALDKTLLKRVHKALEFSMWMQWPGGEIPLINDSDNGDHLELLEKGARLFDDSHLQWAATLGREGKPPGDASAHFHRSGYFTFCNGWGEDPKTYAKRQHVFYDCAELGEGSHSHYDLFNFSYYAHGEPGVIDPGRYTYSSDPDSERIDWRKRFKSTAYHNTVTIDGKDQTRYLSRTKHGPEIEIIKKSFYLGRRSDWVSAGARSAEYSPVHKRVFTYFLREYLFILDDIDMEDGETHECALRFHLSHKWLNQVSLKASDSEISVRSPLLRIQSVQRPGMRASIEKGWVSEKYGVKKEAPVVELVQTGSAPLFFATLLAPEDLHGDGPALRTVTLMPPSTDRLLVFRVEVSRAGDPFSDWFLFQRGMSTERVQIQGIAFHGRFLAFRQNRHGEVVHLIGQKIEQIEIGNGPDFRINRAQDIEWSSEQNG